MGFDASSEHLLSANVWQAALMEQKSREVNFVSVTITMMS